MFMVFFLWAEVEAQRCAATLPVGETWGSKGKGGRSGGGSPAWQGRAWQARVCTRPTTSSSLKIFARNTGETAPAGTASRASPLPARGRSP